MVTAGMLREPWVLLVEDSPSDRELTMLALDRGRFQHRVHAAQDGVEALDLLFCRGAWAGRDRTDHPRVILLDVTMPPVNGFDVLREIKADEHLRDVPVVMLTSSSEQGDLIASYALGVNSYVVKPVDLDEFFATVRGVAAYWLTLNLSAEPGP
jgi:two-component system response regulator